MKSHQRGGRLIDTTADRYDRSTNIDQEQTGEGDFVATIPIKVPLPIIEPVASASLNPALTPSPSPGGRGAPETPDAELIGAFVHRRDAAAFTQIVERYGPMVYRVALRLVADRHVADDVFQATFLVLAQTARKIKNGDYLAAWLHGTARNIARRALTHKHTERQQLARVASLTRAEKGGEMSTSVEADPLDELVKRHEQQLLDEELQQLSEANRAPLVLFYLEAKSQAEIAQLMGLSVEAVEGRLKRAKQELRLRLIKRGVTLTSVVAAATVWLPSIASAAPSSTLISTTVSAALGGTLASTTLATGSTTAATLATKEVVAMSVASKATAMFVATTGAVTVSVGLLFGGLATSFGTAPSRPSMPFVQEGSEDSDAAIAAEFVAEFDGAEGEEPVLLAQAVAEEAKALVEGAAPSAESQADALKVITYQVADLSDEQRTAVLEFAQGRATSAVRYEKTQSLVIRGDAAIHKRISAYIENLRDKLVLHETEVAIEPLKQGDLDALTSQRVNDKPTLKAYNLYDIESEDRKKLLTFAKEVYQDATIKGDEIQIHGTALQHLQFTQVIFTLRQRIAAGKMNPSALLRGTLDSHELLITKILQEWRINQALNSETPINAPDSKLKDVLNSIAEFHGINIAIDLQGLNDVGLTEETRVRFVPSKRLADSLDAMLKEAKLDYIVENETLMITLADRKRGGREELNYDLSHLSPAQQAVALAYADSLSPATLVGQQLTMTLTRAEHTKLRRYLAALTVDQGALKVGEEAAATLPASIQWIEQAQLAAEAALQKKIEKLGPDHESVQKDRIAVELLRERLESLKANKNEVQALADRVETATSKPQTLRVYNLSDIPLIGRQMALKMIQETSPSATLAFDQLMLRATPEQHDAAAKQIEDVRETVSQVKSLLKTPHRTMPSAGDVEDVTNWNEQELVTLGNEFKKLTDVLGKDHPDVASIRQEYHRLLVQQMHRLLAEHLKRELQMKADTLGVNHPEVQALAVRLARSRQGKVFSSDEEVPPIDEEKVLALMQERITRLNQIVDFQREQLEKPAPDSPAPKTTLITDPETSLELKLDETLLLKFPGPITKAGTKYSPVAEITPVAGQADTFRVQATGDGSCELIVTLANEGLHRVMIHAGTPPPHPFREVSDAELKILRAMDSTTSLELPDNSLQEACDFIARQYEIKIVINEDALKTARMKPDPAVSLKVNGVTLREGLHVMLAGVRLEFCIDEEAILVTTTADLKQRERLVTYRLSSLSPEGLAAAEEFITPLAKSVAPLEGELLVDASLETHGRFEEFLKAVQKVDHQRPPRPIDLQPKPAPAPVAPPVPRDQESKPADEDAVPDREQPPRGATTSQQSPEVQIIMATWQEKAAKVESLSCSFHRFEYDNISGIESRTEGKLQFQWPSHGRIDFEPASQEWMDQRSRMKADGKPFRIVAGDASSWISTGDSIYILDVSEKTYHRIELPFSMQNRYLARLPPQLQFGMRPVPNTEEYSIELGKLHNPNGDRSDSTGKPLPKRIHLIAKSNALPIQPQPLWMRFIWGIDWHQEYSQFEYLLDPETYLPLHLRMIEPAGNRETVYTFNLANQQTSHATKPQMTRFKAPNLEGWTRLSDTPTPQAAN